MTAPGRRGSTCLVSHCYRDVDESDGELCTNCLEAYRLRDAEVAQLARERYELRAEVERMRPVVEAARRLASAMPVATDRMSYTETWRATAAAAILRESLIAFGGVERDDEVLP